jgi:2-methylisocitrate lyase-like PEP mutase family enzyme
MSRPRNARLSELIRQPGRPLLLPGAPNALTARVLERTGFEAVYVSGAGVSNSFLGAPDIGLLSMPEMVGHVAAISDAVDIPLVVDADTGYGNALNVQRAIRMLERAGASAVQLEDQVTPKRCGHFEGKEVIETEEMIGKIKAAVDARLDDGLIIIARTDARAELGLQEACDRAARYLEAGADILFVEAPIDLDELAAIPRLVPAPHVANMVEGGHTPIVPLRDLGELGFAVVLYANTAMRAAITSMEHVAEELLRHGDSSSFTQQIATWEQRQNLVRKDAFDKLDLHYGSMT